MCLIDVVACGWGEGVAEVVLDSRSTRAGMAFPEQYGGVEIDRRSVLTISTKRPVQSVETGSLEPL